MCPYPDVPASVRGSRPSPPLELNGAGPQGHRARTSLERALRKIPPEESGGHHAVYPEVCNRQKGAHVALPTDVQKVSPC